MKWFEGNINEAVATSKAKKAIFVVFVEGKDELSSQLAQTVNTAEVSSRLEQEEFVAIRIESDSETYGFFAQIYQLVPIPSLFFIGENGSPLEIIAGTTTVEDLTSKIAAVLSKTNKNTKFASTSLIEAEQRVSSPSSNKLSEDAAPKETQLRSNETESTSKVEDEASDASASSSNNQSKKEEEDKNATLTTEDKVERARLLMEQQRKKRVEEEKRKAIEDEKKRRKVGQEAAKWKRTLHEQEVKRCQEEKMKARVDEAAAREKVRQQIAQDKLERKQRELNSQQPTVQQPTEQRTRAPVSDATVTRIQFRLPSGNPHMGQFEPTSTLRSLRTYVTENIELPFTQFTMSTSFPRRDLTAADDNKTLLELELVPTAVILILPLKHSNTGAVTSSNQTGEGILSRFMWTLFAPVVGIYNYILGYFSGAPRGRSVNESGSRSNSGGVSGAPIRNIVQQGLLRRNIGGQGTRIRADGNVHRLHSGGDDSDENNTWNGNSTQQM